MQQVKDVDDEECDESAAQRAELRDDAAPQQRAVSAQLTQRHRRAHLDVREDARHQHRTHDLKSNKCGVTRAKKTVTSRVRNKRGVTLAKQQ